MKNQSTFHMISIAVFFTHLLVLKENLSSYQNFQCHLILCTWPKGPLYLLLSCTLINEDDITSIGITEIHKLIEYLKKTRSTKTTEAQLSKIT